MEAYTGFFFKATLDPDTPDEVIEVLKYMTGGRSRGAGRPPPPLPDHPFFKTEAWPILLFQGPLHVLKVSGWLRTGPTLTVFSHLECDENDIKKFLNWIYPWLDGSWSSFMGHYYSGGGDIPVFIYWTPKGTRYDIDGVRHIDYQASLGVFTKTQRDRKSL